MGEAGKTGAAAESSKVGRGCGWAVGALVACGIVRAVWRSSWVAGSIVLLAAVGAAVYVGRKKGGTLERVPLLVWGTLATAFVGSLAGIVGRSSDSAAAEKECASRKSQAGFLATSGDFKGARAEIAAARKVCGDAAVVELDADEQRFPALEAAHAERIAREQAAQAAKEAAEHERVAVETFPILREAIESHLKTAPKEIAKRSWAQAAWDLGEAQKHLALFKGTSIESSAEWQRLAMQLGELKKKVDPEMVRIRATAAAEEKARGQEPICTSSKCVAVSWHLQRQMHDPDSFEPDGCTKPVAQGPYWVTKCAYRGKNAFGATVRNQGTFWIQDETVVKVE